MKQTTTKLGVLAFLGLGLFTYAQEGKVGINTETPTATLEVKPSVENAKAGAKTNEGIIAPKLTKARIAAIETPVEGTLVYATDAAYTGKNNSKVAKITEKGYYFYNGTEWVKSSTNDQLWAQRDNNNITETYLIPADANGDFAGYNNNRRFYFNLGNVEESNFEPGQFTFAEVPFSNSISSDLLSNNSSMGPSKYPIFALSQQNRILRESHVSQHPTAFYYGNRTLTSIREVTSPLQRVIGNSSILQFNSGSKLNDTYALAGETVIGAADNNNPNSNVEHAIAGEMRLTNYATINNSIGLRVFNFNLGNTDHMRGTYNILSTNHNNVGNKNIRTARVLDNRFIIGEYTNIIEGANGINLYMEAKSNTTIPFYYGVHHNAYIAANANIADLTAIRVDNKINEQANVDNLYGIRISDIDKGKSNNYAIYTGNGIVKFGDKVGIGVDKPTQKLEVKGIGIFQAQNPVDGWMPNNNYINSHAVVIKSHKQVGNYPKYIGNQGFIGFLNKDEKIDFTFGYDTDEYTDPVTGAGVVDKEVLIDFVDESKGSVKRIVSFKSTGKTGFGVASPQAIVHVDRDADEKYPVLMLSGGTPEYGDLVVPAGESINIGHWDEDSNTYTEKMRIGNEGNVGIGLDHHPTEKLEVAGNVKANTFIASNGSIFPDYVFEKYYTGASTLKNDYHFANLSQVEQYVKENGHLPGYTSAKVIKEQGYIDLTATQLTNVEKIEELYLHTIEQEKALKAKDAKIEKLESDVQELKTLVKQLLSK